MNTVDLYTDLSMAVSTLQPNNSLHLTHINQLAHCQDCLDLLSSILLDNTLSTKQALQLAYTLSRSQKPEFATLLVETIDTLFKQGQAKRAEYLLDSLNHFKSSKIAEQFINYVSKGNLRDTLQHTLINSINSIPQREKIADFIVNEFNQSDSDIKQKLLAIDYPEALVQLHHQALTEGNTALYEQTLEQLKNNPSPYALDTLLNLKNDAALTASETESLKQAAYDLAQRQFSGNRLDYIENKLVQNGYSEQDKTIVLDILSHSEDMIRASKIINNFSTQ